MLQHVPKQPPKPQSFQLHNLNPPLVSLSKTASTPFNHSSFEQNYRHICSTLLSITHSRSLSKGLQLHSIIIKSGFQTIPLVANHLINFYSKSQLPLLSRQIFDETPLKSSTTWSSVISAFSQNELPLLALEFFRDMLGNGVRPDDYNYPSATKSCAILSRLDVGRSIHGLVVKTGYESDVFVGSSMTDMYAKCGDTWDARKVFDEMPERNVVSWSGMIYGYAELGENEEALRLFKRALEEGLDINDFIFSSVVQVCGNSTLLQLGKQIHGLCLKVSYDSSSFVGSSLISLYSKCGVIDGAYQVFGEVPLKNLGVWNAMLIGCAQHARTNQVLDLFGQMGSVATKPNFITFLCVLYACSHAGLVKEGQYYFDLMKTYGIEPGAQHYASLVDLLGRAGKLQEALEVIEEMPMEPTESVWGALLTGCRLHKDAEMAAYVADRLFKLDPLSSGLHVLLSNAYAAAGRHEEAAKARKMLRDRRIKKETGFSWVEEGNRVHTFAAGDRFHPKSNEIYMKLDELGDEMEKAVYVADTNFVLQQVDDHVDLLFYNNN
ncbi:Putative pentatricopeptide repeat-containing protein At5g52630 [Ancistrocladus abbreviatus]